MVVRLAKKLLQNVTKNIIMYLGGKMKKSLLIIVAVILVIIFSICGFFITKNTTIRQIKKENRDYEYYLGKTLLGTDVTSLINKAIDQNERNGIPKNEKGYYIENGKDSLKIELEMITIEKTYPMEEFYKNDMTNFVENFNTIKFECTNIEYHNETGKISKIKFKQLEY